MIFKEENVGWKICFIIFGKLSALAIIYYYHLFDAQLVSYFACENFKLASFESFRYVLPFFFTNFLIFLHKMFWEHLVFSMFQPSNQPFSQGALVPFNGKWYLEIKIWVLGVLKLLLGWETASRLF